MRYESVYPAPAPDKRPAKSRSLSLAKLAARVGAASAAVSHLVNGADD